MIEYSVSKDDLIMDKKNNNGSLIILINGEVELIKYYSNGTKENIFLKNGDIFGDLLGYTPN